MASVETIEEAPNIVVSQVTSGSVPSASPAVAAMSELSHAMISAQDSAPMSAQMMDGIPLGVSAGGVSEESGSESCAGSRWIDSSDDEGGQGVQEDAGDSVGGRGVRGSGTAVGEDGLKGGRKSLDSEGTATAGGE